LLGVSAGDWAVAWPTFAYLYTTSSASIVAPPCSSSRIYVRAHTHPRTHAHLELFLPSLARFLPPLPHPTWPQKQNLLSNCTYGPLFILRPFFYMSTYPSVAVCSTKIHRHSNLLLAVLRLRCLLSRES
jgi:hypothetical protein